MGTTTATTESMQAVINYFYIVYTVEECGANLVDLHYTENRWFIMAIGFDYL